ncbi:uncharacterized protein PV07_03532 [Cladophialophora immunda]|uniref:Uncharacterized protein n=1 Tax=Cladophialophora immunda TaxID=569365 RepID=A0A0D1ZUZ8_9EURO|nr:uncharacterized protein PV07_03532 [Cladophialophora immunda]KIW31946.1 hypothetical protein PV07_03532 [Cladophialophora immunda]
MGLSVLLIQVDPMDRPFHPVHGFFTGLIARRVDLAALSFDDVAHEAALVLFQAQKSISLLNKVIFGERGRGRNFKPRSRKKPGHRSLGQSRFREETRPESPTRSFQWVLRRGRHGIPGYQPQNPGRLLSGACFGGVVEAFPLNIPAPEISYPHECLTIPSFPAREFWEYLVKRHDRGGESGRGNYAEDTKAALQSWDGSVMLQTAFSLLHVAICGLSIA